LKIFQRRRLSLQECVVQLESLERLLQTNEVLEERRDIIPFFRANPDLTLLIGFLIAGLNPELFAEEYELFGDFVCDLAIGDSRSKRYLFIEIEDARSESLFVPRKGKTTPEWSPRLERGFSQVVDWLWRLDDAEASDDYQHRFGTRHAEIHGMILIGRDQRLEERELRRLAWRQFHTIVQSKKIAIVTFERLLQDLKYWLAYLVEAAHM
jgi:hypothetical protein